MRWYHLRGSLGRLRSPVVVALTLAPAAAAAFAPPPGQRPPPVVEVAQGPAPRDARPLRALPPTAAASRAWAHLLARQGRAHALWDAATAVPAYVLFAGRPALQDSPSLLADARALLAEHLDLLAPGCALADLELVADDTSGPLRTLGYRQRSGGLPVVGAQLSLRYAHGRLVAIASQALPCPADAHALADPVAPARARARALAWLAADGMTGLSVRGDVGAPVVLPRLGERGLLRRDLALPVVVDVAAPRGRYLVHVDARTGAPLDRRQLLTFAAGLEHRVPVQRPTDAYASYPAAHADITVDGLPQTTDLAGAYALDAPGELVTRPVGPYVRVLNDAGPVVSATWPAQPGEVIVWGAGDQELDDAQLATFIHAGIVKRHVQAIDPVLPWLQGQLQATVNIGDVCNAFSDGDTINFYQSGGGCENTGRLADVVYHEFGHSVHAQSLIPGVGAFNVSLSEGISDYLAATLSGDPSIGRGFFFDATPIRDLDPPGYEWRWPEDKGEVHDEGRIIGGALWDLRKALSAKLGPAVGIARTDYLWYQAIRRAVDIPSMFIETLIADDDNGDLGDGTPNACEIADVFAAHGLRPITVDAPSVTTSAPGPAGTTVTLDFATFLPQCGLPAVSATLEYRLREDPGVSGAVPMIQGPQGLTGQLPPFPDDSVVQYRVRLQAGGGLSQDLPQNLVDPWYELYVGPVVPLYCTDFEQSGPIFDGWTWNDFTGSWQWGAPSGGGAIDPPAAYSGARVFGVVLDDGGLYPPLASAAVTTPPIDTAGYKRVRLQYRRWLTVEDGFYDQATISADGARVWSNFAGPHDFDSANHHIDQEWRFHDVDLSAAAQDGVVQVRFELQSDPGLEFGGWTLDDLCVVGVPMAAPLCGDGVLDPGEACDQGPANSDVASDACRTDCTRPRCGDGVVDSGERCDDGNLDPGDGCDPTCALERPDGGDTTGDTATTGDDTGDAAGLDSDLVDRGCVCAAGDPGDPRPALGLLALALLARRRRTRA